MEELVKELTQHIHKRFIEHILTLLADNRSKHKIDPETWSKWSTMWRAGKFNELFDKISNHEAIVILQKNQYFITTREQYLQERLEQEQALQHLATAIKTDKTLRLVKADDKTSKLFNMAIGTWIIKELPEIILTDKDQEYNLGPFEIALNIHTSEIRAKALKPVYCHFRKSFFHPHVNEHCQICFGEASAAASRAQERRDILSLLDIAESVLNNYFEPGAYVRLNRWFPPACRSCGSTDAHNCATCGTPHCNDHSIRCSKCGAERCESCEPVCTVCKAKACNCELSACTTSGDLLCTKCTITCADCQTTLSPKHADTCASCGTKICSYCGTTCDVCGKVFCSKCEDQLVVTGGEGDEQTHACPECAAK